MDQTQLQENIALFYTKLPSTAQAYFAGQTWMATLEKINSEFNLNDDQVKTLATETTLVLLGIIHSSEFESNIKSELDLPISVTEQIISIVNRNIIASIRTDITNTYENNINTEVVDFKKEESKLDPQFDKLPIEVQKAIAMSDYQKKLYAISEKHKLKIDMMGQLENITISLMKGDISVDDYQQALIRASSLPEDKVKEVIDDVNNDILKNIRTNVIKKPDFSSVEKMEDEVPIPPYAVSHPALTEGGAGGGDITNNHHPVLDYQNTPPRQGGGDKPTYHGHDIYAESGIEILDDRINHKESIPTLVKKDTASIQAHIDIGNIQTKKEPLPTSPTPITQKVEKINVDTKQDKIWETAPTSPNIISNKLAGTTSSVVHDPYHEEI